MIAVVVLAAAVYGIYAFLSRSRAAPFQSFTMSKVTESGKVTLVAISPDAKYLLHVVDDGETQSLWIRHIATNSNTQVVAPAPVNYLGLRFSPDGNYLYFVRSEVGNRALKYLYRAPVLGGEPQKLITDIDSNISFSPDGKRIAYLLFNNPDVGKYRLIIRSLDSGEEKTLTGAAVSVRPISLAWSPDGKTIVHDVVQPGDALSGLVAVDTTTGKERLFFTTNSALVTAATWLPDGSGLLVLSAGVTATTSRRQIVFVSYPDGKSHPITRDTNSYEDLSLAADGHTLATVVSESHYGLYLAASDGASPKQLVSAHGTFTADWTPAGQILIDQDGRVSLLNPDSNAKTALTPEGQVSITPSACADGRYVVFSSVFQGGKRVLNVWRMDANGSNPKQLTNGKVDRVPVCSADGRSVFYVDQANGGRLNKVPIDGGTSEKISDQIVAGDIDLSPDGKLVAFHTFHMTDAKGRIALVSAETDKTERLLDLERPPQGVPRFSHDGKVCGLSHSRRRIAQSLAAEP